MIFNSISFIIFFPLVLIIYAIIPRKIKYIWLLVCSYYFYMCWNARYAILIAASTIITYLAALLLMRIRKSSGKKMILFCGLVSNLGILFFFKYFDFFLTNINRLLSKIGFSLIDNPFDFLLPVGISFYTFQALGYLIDVYRGDCPAERNFLKYALFVSFFPQLVAGPIERSKNLLAQINNIGEKKLMSYEGIVSGFSMMAYGMFLKMVIADRAAILVKHVFEHIYLLGSVEAILGAVLFAIQIYCDFGGYSAIAIGCARVLGFELMENFNTPYFATSISDFWHRWHISLSTWLRDYIYIPLGGNRKGKFNKYCNLMITFLTSGLWHGANWTYVIWGFIHGILQIGEDLLHPLYTRITDFLRVKKEVFSYHLGQIIFTFCLTDLAWIFFRASSVRQALVYFNRLFTRWNPWVLFDGTIYNLGLNQNEFRILQIGILFLFATDMLRVRTRKDFGCFMIKQNLLFRYLVLLILCLSCIVYGVYGVDFDSSHFLYFAF